MEFIDKVKGYLNQDQVVTTKFLDLNQQAILKNLLRKKVDFSLFGGYEGAELKRASINSNDNFDISCIKISYNPKYLALSHQNILGTLLSLSIEKSAIGDILPKQGVFFITKEIKDFILTEFTEISNVSITLEEIESSDIKSEKDLEELDFTVDSMRLDSIVSKIARISRNQSLEMLKRDLIKVNHLTETKAVKIIRDNDIISIRKYGRFIIIDTSKKSRKGKIIVKYGKYV
jgi:RNA-binding protein YlmH